MLSTCGAVCGVGVAIRADDQGSWAGGRAGTAGGSTRSTFGRLAWAGGGLAVRGGSGPSSFAPPPAPAPAPAAPGARLREQRLTGDWRRIDVDGGYLLWSKTGKQLDAHCQRHKDCKVDRTLRPAARGTSSQGRPLGRQLAWLAAGATCPTRAEHQGLKATIGRPESLAMRIAARSLFWEEVAARDPIALEILADERPCHPGEGAEPDTAP